MKRNRIEIVDDGAGDPGAGPDFARFKPVPAEDGAPPEETAEERRKRLERERAKRRRARAKGTMAAAAGEMEIDLATCHFANVFLLNIVGVIAKRRIEPTAEQSDALDKSLQQIGQKYGGWLLAYAPEIAFATTLIVIVATSPRLEEVSVAEPQEQDRRDSGAQG
jgi:hypothetical protein